MWYNSGEGEEGRWREGEGEEREGGDVENEIMDKEMNNWKS